MKVWWIVIHGVNLSHLWDGESFDRLRDAKAYYESLPDGKAAQLWRHECKDKWSPATKKLITEKNV